MSNFFFSVKNYLRDFDKLTLTDNVHIKGIMVNTHKENRIYNYYHGKDYNFRCKITTEENELYYLNCVITTNRLTEKDCKVCIKNLYFTIPDDVKEAFLKFLEDADLETYIDIRFKSKLHYGDDQTYSHADILIKVYYGEKNV